MGNFIAFCGKNNQNKEQQTHLCFIVQFCDVAQVVIGGS
jgi:hypothetical protein